MKPFTQSLNATASLFDSLKDIFRNIEPCTKNLDAYGHKSRELLILACTEIETAWRAILIANTDARREWYFTSDYFRLKEALRLHSWILGLRDYPDLGSLSPFVAWSRNDTTKSLAWYDAYNAVEHHREDEFERVTLRNLLDALAALAERCILATQALSGATTPRGF